MTTNYEWAGMVLLAAGLPVTENNEANIVRWMAAEQPDSDWWNGTHLNPLDVADYSNNSYGFPSLAAAANATAAVIRQSNMAVIYDVLARNGGLADFSAACAASPWSTGGYHGHPDAIASIPQQPVVTAPGTVPTPVPVTPTPPPIVTPSGEPTMFAYDPETGGYWATDENGDLYTGGGAPFIGGLTQHPAWQAGQAESGGTDPCVGLVYWGKPGHDGITFFTKPASGKGGWAGTPYNTYTFLRNGTAA